MADAHFAVPELIRVQRHLEGLDPSEVAFRAVACLNDEQMTRLADRFSEVFGKGVPPKTMSFTFGTGEAQDG